MESGAVLHGVARPRRPKSLRARFGNLLSFRWAAIALILIGWFVYYPIVDNFIVSTTDQDIYTGEVTNVGLANYDRLLHDPVALLALWNNCLYAVISVVFQVFGAFLLAAITEDLRSECWRRLWRAVYFVP